MSNVRLLRNFGSVDAFADALKAMELFHIQHTSDLKGTSVDMVVRLF